MPVAILVHGDRSRMVSQPTSWEDLMTKIKRFLSLDQLDEDKLILIVHPDWSNAPLELDPSALSDFHLPDKSRITITINTDGGDMVDQNVNDGCKSCHSSSVSEKSSVRAKGVVLGSSEPFQITLTENHGTITCTVRPSTAVESLLKYWDKPEVLQARGRAKPQAGRFVYGGQRKKLDRTTHTMSELGVIAGDVFEYYPQQVGRKPAIYLLTPEAMSSLQVAVQLSNDWQLTVLHPPIKGVKVPSSKYSATWTVDVKRNGIMSDHATNMDTSCLFWEAASILPNGGRVIDQGTFTPNTPKLTLARSRLIERDDLVPYLHKCLETLCLTPAMRTDFITFWLPEFYELHEKNFDVALNFVKQTEYEEAARLTFSQKPAAVVRIFMVFGGVLRETEQHAEWMANQGGPQTPEGWRDVVGISKEVLDVMADKTKFRAVEWGAMFAVPSM